MLVWCRAFPRSAAAFTGNSGGEGCNRGPGGVVLLCVNNTAIPCKSDSSVKAIQFTVLNVREKGWIKAPWYTAPPSLALLPVV